MNDSYENNWQQSWKWHKFGSPNINSEISCVAQLLGLSDFAKFILTDKDPAVNKVRFSDRCFKI